MENKKETIDLLARKKILIVCHTLSAGGGSEKVLNTLIHELAVSFDIDIIERLEDCSCVYKLPSNVTRLKSMSYTQNYLKAHNIKWSFCALFRRRLLSFITILFPSLIYSFYINRRYDYEISFNYLYSSFLIAHSSNKDSKKIMWIHSSVEDLFYKQYDGIKFFLYYFYHRMQKKAFQKSDKIVAISEFTKKTIEDMFPCFCSKICLINNGYDFKEIEERSNDINRFPVYEGFNIITIGRLEERKNIILQIEVMKFLINEGLNVHLSILGSGELRNTLIESSKSISANVHFLDFVENPYPYLKEMDMFLMTSLNEGFPTVIVEALSLGIPVVSTPVAGTKELINVENGCVTNWTIESIASGIKMIMNTEFDVNKIKSSIIGYTKERWANNVIIMLNTIGRK